MTRALQVDELTVDYGGIRALDDVSLTVEEHTTVGLIGPNGAGKTTLFDTVLGLIAPSSGRVQLFGDDVTDLPMHKRARLGLGRTFQRLELFGSLTVLENLVVALESVSSVGGLASELLRRPSAIDVRLRAHDAATELLALVGLDADEETRAADLPMGHARLLEFARALATKPRLLLLDEPSSGLNVAETERLGTVLERLKRERGFAMLVVEHDMDFVLGLSEKVCVLDFGKVIAEGTPAQIQRNERVRGAYLGLDGAERLPGLDGAERLPGLDGAERLPERDAPA